MAVRKQLTKLGHSAALIIDPSILQLLDISMDATLEISVGGDGKSLVLRPVSDGQNQKVQLRREFEEAVEESLRLQGEVYRKLADC